jgi:hypothetical protein
MVLRQKDVSRVLKGVQATGATVKRLVISPDGKIAVEFAILKEECSSTELDQWINSNEGETKRNKRRQKAPF